jgi:hypothetical protein
MAIDQDALLAAIDAGRDRSYGTDEQSTLGLKRARAIEAYLGLNTNPAPEGRSQVVDRSVYETISTILPSLVRIFVSSSDEVCKFMPVGPEDEQAAEQCTAVVNHVVTQQNQWEQICADWIHDACLLSNGYAMAYWDDSTRMVREKYEGQSEDQVAALLQDHDIKVLEHSAEVDDETTAEAQQAYEKQMQQWQQAVPILQSRGQPIPPQPEPPQPVMEHDLVIEREESEGKVCIRVIPPEHCYVDAETPDWTLQDCRYFEVVQEKTIADLRSMGLDVPIDVSDDEDIDESQEDVARNRFGESDLDDTKGVMRMVNARSIWVQADVEGDEQSRMYYVIAVGRTILYSEPCSRIPIASMTPQPLPHRHIGMSIAETVFDVQQVKTAIKRGGLDNLYLANNGRHIISSKVNLNDLLDSRPGGVVRMLDDSLPAEGHVLPLNHPFAFDSIIGSLEYFDQERQNRSGASRYFSGTDANAINKTASGTIALQNMAAMRVEHIARMMAPAIEHLFSVVHEMILKHANKAFTIKLKGQWTTVDPQAWLTKRDVRISVGVGAGNKDSMYAQLQQTLATQLQTIPLGLAGPEEMSATVTEMAKLAGFANPRKFWKDPQDIKPMPPPPNPEAMKAQTEMQKMQFSAQQDQMKAQAEQVLERQRVALEMKQAQNEQEWQARQKQLELQQQAELEKIRAAYQAQSDAAHLEFERWKAELDAVVKLKIAGYTEPEPAPPDTRLDMVLERLEMIGQDIAAPAQIVRDPASGRAIGVRKGGRSMRVLRDASGKPVGLQ